jgi:AmmeMemoRadiSam system protein A
MPSLPEADRLALLHLARSAIVELVSKGSLLIAPADGVFAERRGVFVTLHVGDRLRGCIGVLEGRRPLGEAVVHCAAGAAREDPRFPPVQVDELASIHIELSILSPLTPIRPEDIVIGMHGLAIMAEGRKGVLLPQVAIHHRLDRERFLAETCRKAGLPPDAWRQPETQIFGFTSEVFSELRQSR